MAGDRSQSNANCTFGMPVLEIQINLICGLVLGMHMKSKLLSKQDVSVAEKVVDEAFNVYKVLGPSLLERVYEVCLFFITFVASALVAEL